MDGSHLLCLMVGTTVGVVVMGRLAALRLARWQQKFAHYVLRERAHGRA